MRIRVNWFDILIFSSIAYAVSDLLTNWESYSQCKYPMNIWLMVSYALTVLIRGFHFIGHWLSIDDNEYEHRDLINLQDQARVSFNWKNDEKLKSIRWVAYHNGVSINLDLVKDSPYWLLVRNHIFISFGWDLSRFWVVLSLLKLEFWG